MTTTPLNISACPHRAMTGGATTSSTPIATNASLSVCHPSNDDAGPTTSGTPMATDAAAVRCSSAGGTSRSGAVPAKQTKFNYHGTTMRALDPKQHSAPATLSQSTLKHEQKVDEAGVRVAEPLSPTLCGPTTTARRLACGFCYKRSCFKLLLCVE